MDDDCWSLLVAIVAFELIFAVYSFYSILPSCFEAIGKYGVKQICSTKFFSVWWCQLVAACTDGSCSQGCHGYLPARNEFAHTPYTNLHSWLQALWAMSWKWLCILELHLRQTDNTESTSWIQQTTELTGVAASTIACRPWAIFAKSLVSRSKILERERSQS